ncbi:MAG TPA: amino acid deaminase, partial [Glaciihabitans sp.]|nr:amino acid deaminase [Glaciihabitans sp.]
MSALWPAELEPYLTALGPLDKNWNALMAAGATRLQIPLAKLATPAFTLNVEAVHHNISTMQAWVDSHGLLLAPHGKTTMTPGLWWWQLAAGSWAITVANEAQLRVARSVGIARVIVANQILSPQALAWLATEMATDPHFEVICWVDSVEAVAVMEAGLAASAASRPVLVCVERGAPGGRTGARTHTEAVRVAEAVVASAHLSLAGVSGFEGSVTAGSDGTVGGTREGAVRFFLDGMAHTFVALAELFETDSPILTAGGSTDFDLVAEIFTPVRATIPSARLIVRSGCYAIHDDGLYRDTTPAATRSGPHFIAAAHVWARVL